MNKIDEEIRKLENELDECKDEIKYLNDKNNQLDLENIELIKTFNENKTKKEELLEKRSTLKKYKFTIISSLFSAFFIGAFLCLILYFVSSVLYRILFNDLYHLPIIAKIIMLLFQPVVSAFISTCIYKALTDDVKDLRKENNLEDIEKELSNIKELSEKCLTNIKNNSEQKEENTIKIEDLKKKILDVTNKIFKRKEIKLEVISNYINRENSNEIVDNLLNEYYTSHERGLKLEKIIGRVSYE